MYNFITILIVIDCVLLGLVVLIQNPKGGGLSATFGGVGNQILGARRSTDFIEKATWTLAIVLFVLSLVSAVFVPKQQTTVDVPRSVLEERIGQGPYLPPAPSQNQDGQVQQTNP